MSAMNAKKEMSIFQGMIESFVVDYGTPDARETDDEETSKILAEIHQEFIKPDVQVCNILLSWSAKPNGKVRYTFVIVNLASFDYPAWFYRVIRQFFRL